MFQSIRFRLALLACVPLLFAFAFATVALKSAYNDSSEISQLDSFVQLVSKAGAYVHEVQKERGATGVFLGSGGEKFSTEVAKQRKQTDASRVVFEEYLQSFDASLYGEQFEKDLQKALNEIKGVSPFRGKVDQLAVTGKESLTFYTDHNAVLLNLVANASKLSSDATIVRSIVGYESFLQGKERAGIERAILCTTFSSNEFAPGNLQKLLKLIGAQDTYVGNFLKLAPADQAEFYNQTLTGPAVEEVERMRKVAVQKNDEKAADFGVVGSHCFKTMTEKINLMKTVDDRLLADLVSRVSAARSSATSSMWWLSLVTLAVTLGVGLMVFVIAQGITKPLNQALDFAEKIASGNLTVELESVREDEIGRLMLTLNRMGNNLREVMLGLGSNAATLTDSSIDLSETATQMATGADKTTHQASTVAAATEEMSVNMGNIASSTDQMTSGISAVATSIDEMSTSIVEIAKNAEKASAETVEAYRLAQTSNENIQQLGEAAEKIGTVIETIQDIAEQTNLLALNATIEAARAGDAGKGFAVVATEVKELSRQTAEATEDIRSRIEGIQSSTTKAVDSILQISEVIDQVSGVSKTIASAVEEQSITAKEISQNINKTSEAAKTVSVAVAESATATQEITENITHVNTNTQENSANAKRTQQAGQQLSLLSSKIRLALGKFKTDASQIEDTTIMELPAIVPQPIRESFARVQEQDVFDQFYNRFVAADPRMAMYFAKTDFSKQKGLLKESVGLALRLAAGDKSAVQQVAGLGTSHAEDRMNILPELYPIWLNSWISTIAEIDSQWSQGLERQWRENLQPCIDAMASKHSVGKPVGV